MLKMTIRTYFNHYTPKTKYMGCASYTEAFALETMTKKFNFPVVAKWYFIGLLYHWKFVWRWNFSLPWFFNFIRVLFCAQLKDSCYIHQSKYIYIYACIDIWHVEEKPLHLSRDLKGVFSIPVDQLSPSPKHFISSYTVHHSWYVRIVTSLNYKSCHILCHIETFSELS